MSKYLLDTNIWIYYLKGQFNLKTQFEKVGFGNLSISEISIAELKYGAYNSQKIDDNLKVIESLVQRTTTYFILPRLDIYGSEKTRLRNEGMIIDDFDLLIAATSIASDLILVTRNTKHFSRIKNIQLENCID